MWLAVQFSRTVERRKRRLVLAQVGTSPRRVSRRPADAGLSKLNSMLDLLRSSAVATPSSEGGIRLAAIQPGSVDVLGPIRIDTAGPRGLGGRAGSSEDEPWIGAPLGAP